MAFIGAPLVLHTQGKKSSFTPTSTGARARARTVRPRTASIVRACADAAGGSDEELPPEPYPGYLNDLIRSGASEEEAKAMLMKTAAQKSNQGSKSTRVGGAKSLFKEDGTAYAPWMAGFPTSYNTEVIKSKSDAQGRLAADPQQSELSGVGLSYKLLGDEVELKWATGSEEGNIGFVVSRRAGRAAEWVTIADYKTNPGELVSKGPQGGAYSFLVTDAGTGTFVYRVSDVDSAGNKSDLAQCLIEIEAEEDTKVRLVALAALLGVLALAIFAGVSLDPLSST